MKTEKIYIKNIPAIVWGEESEKAYIFDHSFLSFKKELLPFGFEVGKISMKNKSISFIKTR